MGATVLIRVAYRGYRWFDRMVLWRLSPRRGAPIASPSGRVKAHDGSSPGHGLCAGRLVQVIASHPSSAMF